jgi:type IV secretory pathway TraG/TraD family ATPase VirD4
MRQNDPETAEWIAKSFGQIEIMEAQQGLSYGANDMRDGVSLTQLRKLRPLLIPSEVSNLDDLEGYIRLPGRLPVAHVQLQWKNPRLVAPAFIQSTAARVFSGVTVSEAAASAPTVSGDLFLPDAHDDADAIRVTTDTPAAP